MKRAAHLLLALALLPAALRAADDPPPPGRGWHVVRPGDTLEGITAFYLGSPARWRENWALNPAVRDPNLLRPGERLQVMIEPGRSRPAAQLRRRAREVDARQLPRDWTSAVLGDLLVSRDGVRTGERSSAELAFTDGSRVWMTERSLVFLRPAPGAGTRPGARREVEVVTGHADVELAAPPAAAAEVELVMGGTRASLRAPAGESAQSRARREEERAAVMVYRGEGQIAAAGSRVALAAGTGSVVAAGGPPAPAESLLPAPRPLAPEAGEARGREALFFAWEEVEGGAGYAVELCADPECGELVERFADLPAAPFRPPGELPLGELFWRVTPTAASGLDGYPSPAVGFTLLAVEPPRDRTPPSGELVLLGVSWEAEGSRFVRADARVEARVKDPEGSEVALAARLDGEPLAADRLAGPWEDGPRRIELTAADAAGNRAELAPVEFVADGTPPTLVWSKGVPPKGARSGWSWLARLEWRAPQGNWTTWKWLDRRNYLKGPRRPPLAWGLVDGRPELWFTARRAVALGGDIPVRLEKGESIVLRFADEGSGLARVELARQLPVEESAADGPAVVRVTATDNLGNAAVWRVELDLR